MNCLGYYTFSFGKLKIGIRENSATVEAFTVGNIVFNSPPAGSAQALVQPPDRQLRGPGLRVRQQLRHRLRHRPRHAAGRRGGSAVPEIERQPLRHVHQVAGGADHQHPAARGVGRHQRRGVESGAPVGLPDHGARAQHRAGNGLLDDASGHAGWRRASSASSPGSSTRTTPSTCRAARPRTRCTTSSPARSPPTW